jgi:5-enolpyruvylshikimate-3-phosphate synthase
MGVKARIEGDELVVEGYTLVQRLLGSPIRSGMTCDRSETSCEAPGLLKGGAYTSHHDHRMVMALKVASLGADSPIFIDDEACVSKSFPQFLDMFGVVECNK